MQQQQQTNQNSLMMSYYVQKQTARDKEWNIVVPAKGKELNLHRKSRT